MAVMDRITVEPMVVGDIPAAHEIERLSFRTPWPAQAFHDELTTNRLAHYVVARRNDRVVGFAGAWLMVDETHITTFSVHPDHRRRGVGRRLLLALLDRAQSLGAVRMTLEVRPSNGAAQALYRECGFIDQGRRPGYYTDDGVDALVMTTPALDDPAFQDLLGSVRQRLEASA